MNFDESFDCVVMGGGPAGSTVSTLLADYGHRVVLLEQSQFPRHHIGESLMPETYWVFQRLGMLAKLKASDYPRKESVQFVSATGAESQPFYFTDRYPHECSVTWQVRRDTFDQMMLDNAREHGVDVRQGVRVKDVLFEGERAVGVRAGQNGTPTDLGAQVVIDATGMSAVMSRHQGTRFSDPELKNAAIYAYWRDAAADTGRNAGATIVIRTPARTGWFWFIPLPNNVTSIGVVAPPSYLVSGRGDHPLATLEEEIAHCPHMVKRLANATRVSGVFVTSDFSYRSRRAAGDGWVLIGDAFCFLDPLYSSGLMFALKSGEMAADTIHGAFQTGDFSGERLGAYGPRLSRGIHQVRKLVYAFYDPEFSFAKFHRAHPEFRDDITRILIGDVFKDDLDDVFRALSDWVSLPKEIELEESVAAR